MKVDSLLKNGTLVIPEVGIIKADVLINGGKIVAIGNYFDEVSAKEVIDLDGLYLLPGLVDPHTHLGLNFPYENDCRTESVGALCAGVTTMGVYYKNDDPYEDILSELWKISEEKSMADLFFHLVFKNAHHVENIDKYYHDFGIRSFKVYMAGVPGVTKGLDDGLLNEAMERTGKLPKPPIVAVHAENEYLISRARDIIINQYDDVPLTRWTDTHPNKGEEEAIRRALFFARKAGAKLYIVHLNTKEAASILPELTYPNLYIETTPQYLSLTRTYLEKEIGYLGKSLPPLRDQEDVDAIWEALKNGYIQTIGTDNVPNYWRNKNLESKNMAKIGLGGGCGIDLALAVCLTEGYHRRNFDLVSLVEKMTANPAKIFGYYPQKGSIVVGGDADLVAVDLEKEKVVKAVELASESDFTRWEGMKLKGWQVYTIKAGKVVAKDGKLTEKAQGKVLNKQNI